LPFRRVTDDEAVPEQMAFNGGQSSAGARIIGWQESDDRDQ
jgi:hypothetical protein